MSVTIEILSAYSCKSSNGNDVDWFYAYKLPVINTSTGTNYFYVDSSTNDSSWVDSKLDIDNPLSNIGQTISQIFKTKKTDFYALYNDENPYTNFSLNNRGHMKGVLIFNDFEGIWLIHSVPKFPSTKENKYIYPDSGKRYGQTFLCVTFPTYHLNDIGSQLQVGQVPVYSKNLPLSYSKLYPNLDKAFQKKNLVKSYYSVKELDSKNKQNFVIFSKHKLFNKDLYADLVAPNLKTSLYVESWLNGPNDLPSECQLDYKVYNLRSVHFNNFTFKSSKDHSKWAVSTTDQNPWICIGDINRQVSQKHRGGGTMCLKNSNISSLFRHSISDIESCKT